MTEIGHSEGRIVAINHLIREYTFLNSIYFFFKSVSLLGFNSFMFIS